MIPSRLIENDSLWTKGLEHAQDSLGPPVKRKDILYRYIRRWAIHRAFKELLLGRFKVIQEQRDRRLHKQRDEIDADRLSASRSDVFQDRFREPLVERLWILLEVVRHQQERKSTVHTRSGLQLLGAKLVPMLRQYAHAVLDIMQARDDVNVEALE